MNKKKRFSSGLNKFIENLKAVKISVVAYLIALPFLTMAQTLPKNKYSQKAIELQKNAIKYRLNSIENDKTTYLRMLKMLDSATAIEPTYALAYRTKVIPLVHLKKYSEALVVLRKCRTLDPTNLKDIIKQGIIWESYLNNPIEAKNYYKEAYNTAVKDKSSKKFKNSYYDEVITYSLLFYKGKEEALAYLAYSSKNYKDQKSINQFKILETLIRSSAINPRENKSILEGNN